MSLAVDARIAPLLLAGLCLVYLLNIARLALFNPLRKVPGPFLSRFSGSYKLSLVASGRAPENYRQVHQQYGKIVRVGPNHISISDPAEIPQIYGLGSKFLKVRRIGILGSRILTARDTFLLHIGAILQRQDHGQHVHGAGSPSSQGSQNACRPNVLHDKHAQLRAVRR